VYETHFGLNGRPFAETVNPEAYVAVASRDTVLRRVRYALERGDGPALVFGPPGTGKTLVARVLARDLRRAVVHLAFPALSATEMVAMVAEDLGAGSLTATSLGDSIRRLRQRLATAAARGQRPVLILDEAHLIDDAATFEAVRLLLNFASQGPPDISLLIVGGPEVLLRLPAGLSDRLTARCLLGPLTEEESATYILGRLASAGAGVPLFGTQEISSLHHAADGLPRRLNRLADLALLVAYAEGIPRPDARAVAIASREADLDILAA
jgi:type II secretory pathway predicted ATPase ExeA